MLAFYLAATGLEAQDTTSIAAGTRLRVTLVEPGAGVRVGSYRGRTDTTLELSADASPFVVPLASIARLERSAGRRPGLIGGAVGLVLGVGIGGALACAANRDDYGVYCGGGDDTTVVLGAALGGVAGAALGALLFRRERWRPVDLAQLGTGPP